MKKRLIIMILCVLGVVCAGATAACGAPVLSAPRHVWVEKGPTGDTVYWSESENASGYVVEINGESNTTNRTSMALSRFELVAGVKYEIKVKAVKAGMRDSDWATAEYVKSEFVGVAYRAVDEESYAVSGIGNASGAVVIDDYYLGKPVVAIDDSAFMNVGRITEVVFGSNIVSVGSNAFYGCTSLSAVAFNDGLTEIRSSAFQGCSLLSEVEIPGTVISIGANAFAYCRGIARLSLSDGVEIIGNSAFYACESLARVVTPKSLVYVGVSAFSDCTALTDVELNGNRLIVGSSAFGESGVPVNEENPFDNDEILEVTLNGVEAIGSGAFVGCARLVEINIPDGVTTIGGRAFENCINLADITIGKDVTYIGADAFSNTVLWNEATDYLIIDKWFIELKNKDLSNGDFRNAGFTGIAQMAFSEGKLGNAYMLPAELVYVNSYAFARCEMSSVTLGDAVKTIGDYAFFECKNLRTAVMGNGVEDIGNSVFEGCETLTPTNSAGGKNINIPASVKHIGMSVFKDTAFEKTATGVMTVDNWVVGCSKSAYGNLEIPVGVKGIADGAFYECASVNRIYIPDSVSIIGSSAFAKCTALSSIELPSGLESIEPVTFYMCTSLETITIPNGVKTIGSNAFRSCSKLRSVTIPDSVQTLGDWAFGFCDLLETVVIGNAVGEMGTGAFAYCVSLKSVVLPNSLKSVSDYAFYRCSALESVGFGNGVTGIGERAFYQCTLLSSLVMPDSVTSIGELAFYRCLSLWKLAIGENVNTIGDYAFYGCENLIKVSIPDAVETMGGYVFMDCFNLASVSIGANLTVMGEHVFMNCEKLTIYTEANHKYMGWHNLWNSQYRPVVFGCILSLDKDYVESVTISEGTIVNSNAKYGLTAPQRLGMTFAGWATEPGGEVVYTVSQTADVPVGTTLYAVWTSGEIPPVIDVKPEYVPGWDQQDIPGGNPVL